MLALLASVGFAPCVVDSGSGPAAAAAAATPTASSQHPHPAAAAGSDQGGEGEQRLVLPETHSLEACRVAHAAIDIAEQMLGGGGGGGGSSSSNAGNHSAGAGAGAGSASGDDGGGGKDGEIRASHWCHACGAPIHNDVRPSRWAAQEVGAWRTGGAFEQAGEYRFECKACNVNLCSKCYDGWKGGDGTSTTRPSYRFLKLKKTKKGDKQHVLVSQNKRLGLQVGASSSLQVLIPPASSQKLHFQLPACSADVYKFGDVNPHLKAPSMIYGTALRSLLQYCTTTMDPPRHRRLQDRANLLVEGTEYQDVLPRQDNPCTWGMDAQEKRGIGSPSNYAGTVLHMAALEPAIAVNIKKCLLASYWEGNCYFLHKSRVFDCECTRYRTQ